MVFDARANPGLSLLPGAWGCGQRGLAAQQQITDNATNPLPQNVDANRQNPATFTNA